MSQRKATDTQIIRVYQKLRTLCGVRQELGVARRTVRACLQRAGIKQSSRKITPEMARKIVSTYQRLGSVRAVVRELGVCHATAKRYIVAAGLGRDGFLYGYRLPFRTLTINVSNKELTQLYEQYKSTGKIAKLLGCTPGGVAARLRKAGVEMHGNEKTQFKCLSSEEYTHPYGGGWTGTLKRSIRERDEYKCRVCGKIESDNGRFLPVHHIDYDKDNLDPKNLVVLCSSCHSKTNFRRKHWKRYFRRMLLGRKIS